MAEAFDHSSAEFGGAGALSAGAGYLRSVLALSIAQRHADHSVQALLGRIEGSSTPPELHPDFVYSLNRDSAIIYRSARPVVDVVAPAVQALALLALLIWLDAAIAVVVLVIALLALIIDRDAPAAPEALMTAPRSWVRRKGGKLG